MNDCMICGKECMGECCSGACRAKRSRRTRTEAHAHAGRTRRPVSQDDPLPQDADTAPTTQSTDEQEAAQSTKSDEVIPELEAIFGPCDKASLQHYIDCPDQYIQLLEPERMNWGAWMDMDELRRAGLKCNRVAIPGDWDYAGVLKVGDLAQGTQHPLYAGGLPSDVTTAAPEDAGAE